MIDLDLKHPYQIAAEYFAESANMAAAFKGEWCPLVMGSPTHTAVVKLIAQHSEALEQFGLLDAVMTQLDFFEVLPHSVGKKVAIN